MRFVLNLKPLNDFIDTKHFKMEDLRTITKILSHGSYMATIDLKDAYYLVPMHQNSKKFLRFMWEKKIFEFQCLPFGLCTAPWVFTKLMKPIASHFRSQGWMSVVYLDDWLLIGESYEQCQKNVEITCNYLISLGFIINKSKSNLEPSMKCQYLGFIFDSRVFRLYLPEDKKQRILKLLDLFTIQRKCKIRDFAKLLGSLAAACRTVN